MRGSGCFIFFIVAIVSKVCNKSPQIATYGFTIKRRARNAKPKTDITAPATSGSGKEPPLFTATAESEDEVGISFEIRGTSVVDVSFSFSALVFSINTDFCFGFWIETTGVTTTGTIGEEMTGTIMGSVFSGGTGMAGGGVVFWNTIPPPPDETTC